MAMLPLHINLDLSPGAWVLTIGAAAIFAYVVSSIIAWRRLRQFKGPFLGSFSYLWIIRASLSGRMGEYWNDAAVQYGSGPSSTVRIGPNELLTSDPDMIRRTSAARSKYTRSAWYKLNRADPYRDSMINMLDTAQHDKAKAQMAPGYAGKDNPGLEGDIDAILAQMTDKIRTKYAVKESGGDKKPKLDLATMAQYFTLDSISKVAFGDEFGMIHAERDIHDHIAVLNQVTPSVGTIASVPYFRAVMGSDFVMKLVGPKVGDKRGIGRMMATGRELVAKRFGPDAKVEQDMLGSFVRHGLDQRQCETEALVQIIAGSDTTATTIRCGMLYLMSTPLAYRALQAEIDEGIKAGTVSDPVTNAEANDMPYLQAVILETLRLHPPFTGLAFKKVPPEGDIIEGKQVPGGTLLGPNFWATGRNTAVFGADADVFRPARWLEVTDVEQHAEMRRVAELVFGYGRWGCAGKMIALLEMNKVFVELLRQFDFQLVYPGRPWKSVNYGLFLQRDMWVSVSLREGQ